MIETIEAILLALAGIAAIAWAMSPARERKPPPPVWQRPRRRPF